MADKYFHNVLRLFDVLPNFPFTTSETMGDYYLQTWYIPVASRVAERPYSPLSGPHSPHKKKKNLRKLGNIRKVPKFHRMIGMTSQCPVPPPK